DETMMDAVNRYSRTNYAVAPTILFEFHSDSRTHAAEQAATVQTMAEEHGGSGFKWATRPEDREELWRARDHTLYAALALRPGSRPWISDVCVPISNLAECVLQTKKDHANAPFPLTLVGHAGDGNFHLLYLLDLTNPKEIAAAERLNE